MRVEVFKTVRRDELPDRGIVIPRQKVIKPALRIVIIPAVADGVEFREFLAAFPQSFRRHVPERIVTVFYEAVPIVVLDEPHVAKRILQVRIRAPLAAVIVAEPAHAFPVVHIPQLPRSPVLADEFCPVVIEQRLRPVPYLLAAGTVRTVFVRICALPVRREGGKVSSPRPGIRLRRTAALS